MPSDQLNVAVAPAVLGPEYGEGRVLYLPAASLPAGGVGVELRTLVDDRLALLVYTSKEALTACCGERQGWVAISGDGLHEVRYHAGADVVLWDEPLPEVA
ncbi:SAV_915 family protein [Actinosynnema sp. NPDC002837]